MTQSQDSKKKGIEINSKIKMRQGSGYLKQLYSTARSTVTTTHSHLKTLTTFLVNFIPIDKVDTSNLQVREHFDETELQALAQSIQTHGVLQPILVILQGERYQVIAGERRLRASQLAGLDRIPARILSAQDHAVHEIALRENLDRMDLHPIEEGEGYLSLLETQAYSSHDALAKAFGKPKSRITECIGFTRIPQKTRIALLKTGLKNRALLRKLLHTEERLHESMIQQVLLQEEKDSLPQVNLKQNLSRGKSQPYKPFEYEIRPQGIRIPHFHWKKSEPSDRLKNYMDSLRKLLTELESWI